MAGKLSSILSEMYGEAMAGKDSRRTLGHGLRMQVIVTSLHVNITLKREGQYPSMQEWRTIIKHWPYNTRVIEEPKPSQRGNYYYLGGVVATPAGMQA